MENTPNIILGEANLKAWVNSVDTNNMLNRQVRDNKNNKSGIIKFVETSFHKSLFFYFVREHKAISIILIFTSTTHVCFS